MSLGMPRGGGDGVLGSSARHSVTCRGISLQPRQRAEQGQCRSGAGDPGSPSRRAGWPGQVGRMLGPFVKQRALEAKPKAEERCPSDLLPEAVHEMQKTCRF